MRNFMMFSLGMVLVGYCLGNSADAATKRTGPISTFSGKDEIVEACTNSTSYVNMPGMARTFQLGGTTPASVVVMFQGASSLRGVDFDTGFLRLLIDDVEQTPGEIPVKSQGDLGGTHGFNWQSQRLAPGTHTVRVQWRTDLGSGFCVDARSIIILHR